LRSKRYTGVQRVKVRVRVWVVVDKAMKVVLTGEGNGSESEAVIHLL
jgi:hypothetical protein